MAFLFGWIPLLGQILIKATKQAIALTLLIMTTIALIGWAKTHPAEAQALVQQAADAAMKVLPKLIDAITVLLVRFLDWLSTLGS
jgi:hypothetical protein